MKKLMLICSLLIASNSFAAIVTSKDQQQDCTLYRVTTETAARQANETIFLDRDVYGISLANLDIDFNKREARVQLIANVVMGLNRIVGQEVRIPEQHPDFKVLINQLNRKVFLLERACVDRNNVLVYAKAFENDDK